MGSIMYFYTTQHRLGLEGQGDLLGSDGLFQNDRINNNALTSQAEAVYDLVTHRNGTFGTPQRNLAPELKSDSTPGTSRCAGRCQRQHSAAMT